MTCFIEDGQATLITFSANGAVSMAEVTVTPPGVSTGGPINTTTMRNTTWRTQAAKKLLTLSDLSATVEYAPAFYNEIIAMARTNQLITVTFPDGASLAFWGFIDEFTQAEHVEGDRPLASLKICPTNRNTACEETAPVLTPAS